MNVSRARILQWTGSAAGFLRIALLGCLLLVGSVPQRGLAQTGSADIPQFDVFPGFDRVIPEGNWFPVVCEIRNEGPTFLATLEFRDDAYGNDLVRRISFELPTGTLKRFSFPMFGNSRWGSRYSATLRNESGRVVANQTGITPRDQISWTSPLLGAIPASAAGTPVYPTAQGRNNNASRPVPTVARLQTEMFPDNPIALDGLDALYLNSSRAVDLKEPQVDALMSWLYAGGRLYVGVDAVIDVNGVPWLKGLVPGELGSTRALPLGDAFDSWLRQGVDEVVPGPLQSAANKVYRDVRSDTAFNAANVRVTSLAPVPGARAGLSVAGQTVVYSATRGRGEVVVLLFNPEIEPFRSWKNREWFWARLTGIPSHMLDGSQMVNHGQIGIDGVLGAIVDSRQVRKLPVSALLLLLVAYLVIIGPFDQWWLKKINRQMLTWITFPCYVLLFSVLIWVIGYKLRAGESEWNELQIVDVIPKGTGAELRGTTYASVYSPVNASYPVVGQGRFASIRSEYGGMAARGGLDGSVQLTGDAYRASFGVPVWTSQMLVGDWLKDGPMPFTLGLRKVGEGYEAVLANRELPDQATARIVVDGQVFDLEFPARGNSVTKQLTAGKTAVRNFVVQHSRQFGLASQQRQQALGSDTARYQIAPENATMAISLAALGDENQINEYGQPTGNYLTPGRLDASPLLTRGFALALVWVADYGAGEPMNDFSPRRFSNNTLLRLAIPLNTPEN